MAKKGDSEMKRDQFCLHFTSRNAAHQRMVLRNQAYKAADNRHDIACLVEGPDDGWTVCDLSTAIETELPYTWSYL